jgi:hypothetical protein
MRSGIGSAGSLAAAAAAAAAALLLAAGALSAPAKAPLRFRADLTAAKEVPPPRNASKLAGGRFVGQLRGRSLEWTLRFHVLSSKATAAHLHLGPAGESGPVLVALCTPCKSPSNGTVKLTRAQLSAIAGGKAYVNVETAKNPGGEIRGQVYRR